VCRGGRGGKKGNQKNFLGGGERRWRKQEKSPLEDCEGGSVKCEKIKKQQRGGKISIEGTVVEKKHESTKVKPPFSMKSRKGKTSNQFLCRKKKQRPANWGKETLQDGEKKLLQGKKPIKTERRGRKQGSSEGNHYRERKEGNKTDFGSESCLNRGWGGGGRDILNIHQGVEGAKHRGNCRGRLRKEKSAYEKSFS